MNWKVQLAFALVAILSLTLLVQAEEPRVFLETDQPLPLQDGWKKLTSSKAGPHRNLEVIFMLKQRNLDLLKETFKAVSDPRNARYGQYMSLEQVAEMVAPAEKAVNEMVFFLKSAGVDNVYLTLSKDMLVAQMPTTKAARIFNVQYSHYRHSTGVTSECSLGPYSLPASIAQYVDFVSGVVGLPDIDEPRVKVGGPMAGDDIDPDVIRTRYNITTNLTATHPNNSHAVAEFQAQYYAPSDLKKFWDKFVSFAPFRAIEKVIGYNDPSQPSLEASLDTQYIMGVAPNVTTWFYSMKSFNFFSDLTKWAVELNNETTVPWIHSVSYGLQDVSAYPSKTYIERLDAEFQKCGVRGLSIIFASGDSGSGCAGNQALKCKCQMNPSYPAISEYVTSVGATRFLKGNTGPEGAVKAFGSGGGFAPDILPTGDWQTDAVDHYLNITKLPPPCSFNKSGRATPDVSALGDVKFEVYQGGSLTLVGGTSASAPTFSAVMTLLNDIRLHAGKPVLGFLNPWIYQTFANDSTAFFDVTNGNNYVPDCCGNGGFDCAVGWDAATGVGTPNFAVLKTMV